MVKYQILSWHDIPLQVRAGRARDRVSKVLPDRFQVAVDSAAMAANLAGTDDYLEGFHWGELQERSGTAEEVAEAVIQELLTRYKEIDWRKTAASLSRG